jgi:hypothetical protein
MIIIKLIADRKPHECTLCPLADSIRNRLRCGELVTVDHGGGYTSRSMVPDNRCLVEVSS